MTPLWDEIAYRVGTRDCHGTCMEVTTLGHWCHGCVLAAALEDYRAGLAAITEINRRIDAAVAFLNRVCPDEGPVEMPDTIN